MREPLRDRSRLEHITQAISNVFEFAGNKSIDELAADKQCYYAVVKNIEIAGEAAYKLTRAFCREHPETPWNSISAMRHVLVHDYYRISTREVWKAIHEDLPTLLEQVKRYLADTDWEEWEKNKAVIFETATHKSLIQTAQRMLKKGYSIKEIAEVTGLRVDEIDAL